jgi:hypothetical protein
MKELLKIIILHIPVCVTSLVSSQDSKSQIIYQHNIYPSYPQTLDSLPPLPSPFISDDGKEVIIAFLKNTKYTLVSVSVENDTPHIQYGREMIGKGNQLLVNGDDFPTLKKSGLHSDKELGRTFTITGIPISEVSEKGRPQRSSWDGFMCKDEDIISILKCDNRIVKSMNLTHSQLAHPLFHIWNLILTEYEHGRIGRYWDNVVYVLYNGQKVNFGDVYPTRSFQESIFNDEIRGTWDITIKRHFTEKERKYIDLEYQHLSKNDLNELERKISTIRIGEIQPYYIMRYGFYEGHTMWRADPIAISFIFGLKSLEEIDQCFKGDLYKKLTDHHKTKGGN